MRRIKIGVIGTGNMGKNHVRILLEEKSRFDFVGIYDASAEQAEKIAAMYETKAFHRVEDLLREVEAVVVAVPSSLHRDVGLQVAAHGVHALIEKPLAIGSDAALELVNAFDHAGLKLAVGHVERFNPVFAELEKILRNEQVVAIETRRYSPFDGRIRDASVIEDLLIHDVDLVLHLMAGHAVKRLEGFGRSVRSGRIDFAQAMLEFDQGAQAAISASRITEDKIREIDIHTTESFIRADLLSKQLQVSKSTNMMMHQGTENAYRQDSVIQKIFVPIREPLREELFAFYNALVNDEPIAVDGRTGYDAIKICEAIACSIQQ